MVLIASTENAAHARLIDRWGLLILQLKISRGIRLQVICFAVLTVLQPRVDFPHCSGMVAQGNWGYRLAFTYTGRESVSVPKC